MPGTIQEAAENGRHRAEVAGDETKCRDGNEHAKTSMKHSKKSDEGLRGVSTSLDALLVGGNSLKKRASYID